ncbi:hypothetical protein RRG08_024377 [Elysia crispata]|uniref:Uncharacterized protein n=1 Tax=Elysia crispata TaxID=231223 RepID=A0AAE1DIQ9_9GAST|nr:hypothetical protein RRG08_024377 [Elysia crispata]
MVETGQIYKSLREKDGGKKLQRAALPLLLLVSELRSWLFARVSRQSQDWPWLEQIDNGFLVLFLRSASHSIYRLFKKNWVEKKIKTRKDRADRDRIVVWEMIQEEEGSETGWFCEQARVEETSSAVISPLHALAQPQTYWH